MEYFNTTLEDHKVIYQDATSDYITKHDFNDVQITFL